MFLPLLTPPFLVLQATTPNVARPFLLNLIPWFPRPAGVFMAGKHGKKGDAKRGEKGNK
jgi:hypothetical protein